MRGIHPVSAHSLLPPVEDAAAALIREAQCLLDIGSLAGASDEIQMRRAA